MHLSHNSSKKIFNFILQKNGITIFNNHAIIVNVFEEEVNSLKKLFGGKQQRKGLIYLVEKFQIFLLQKILFKKDDLQQNENLQDLGLLTIKNTCHYSLRKIFG
jgi:hypothetical protein